MSYKPATTALVTGWFGCGVAATALPVLIFWFSRVQHQAAYDQPYQNYQNQYGYMEVDNGSNKPWWYFGSSVQERQEPGGNERETSPVLLAAYLWSLTLFLGILFYGYVALRNNTSTEGVFVALLMFAAYTFISLVVFGSVEGGAVQTEGRMVDEHGFAGQFAVMLYLTNLLWLVFSLVFAFLLRRRARRSAITKVVVDSEDYKIHHGDEENAFE